MSIENVYHAVEDAHKAMEVVLANCTEPSDRDFIYKRIEELINWRAKFSDRHWLLLENYHGHTGKQGTVDD